MDASGKRSLALLAVARARPASPIMATMHVLASWEQTLAASGNAEVIQ
jgi:hypothetical protein